MEVKYRQKNLTMDQKIGIATDYNAGMSIADIRAKYGGISRATVYRSLSTVVGGGEEDAKKEN